MLIYSAVRISTDAAIPMKIKFFGLILLLVGLLSLPFAAQEPPIDPALPRNLSVNDITQRFAAQEQEFKRAREQYTYRQEVRVQTLDFGGRVNGEYTETFDVTFDNSGQRVFKEVAQPHSTLKNISVTKEDIDDIRNRMPFVLTSDELPEYQINYVGQQQLDTGNTYLFDITPKSMEPGRRYFEGRIWVDGKQFQIVKSYGKPVPDLYTSGNENLFPSFTTYRSLIDGKYWFPTSTRADDVLHFSSGDVRIREIVNYTNYQRFGSTSRIIFNGETLPGASDQPQPPSVQGQTPPPVEPAAPGTQAQPSASASAIPATVSPGRVNPAPPSSQSLTSQITALERQLNNAIVQRDIPAWERLLADGYTDVDSSGVVRDKNAKAEEIRSHAYESAAIAGENIKIYGDTVIVVGARNYTERTRRGLATISDRFTDLFLLRGGQWQLASSQSTRLRASATR